MKNEELNNTNTDQLSTKPIMGDNLKLSDELDVGENNYDHGPTLHAISERTKKITRISVVTISIVAGTALIGVSIGQIVLRKIPEITNIQSEVINTHLRTAFDVKNEGSGKVYFTVSNKATNEIAYQWEYSLTNHYFVEIELTPNSYHATFLASNNFDYLQEITGTSFDFVIN